MIVDFPAPFGPINPTISPGEISNDALLITFLSGKENLELYSNDESDMDNLIRLLKMEPYIDQRVKNYSIGMKEKLGIALALLNNPEFVILDEPMNGLDIESTILVRKIIKEYSSLLGIAVYSIKPIITKIP